MTCYEKNENDTIVKLEDEQCIAVEDLIRPEDEEQCTADKKCETYNWITTSWAGCSDGEEGEGSPTVCGLGMIFSRNIFYMWRQNLILTVSSSIFTVSFI